MSQHGRKNPSVEITRDWNHPNPLRVEGQDPSKSYRWVDKNNMEQKKYQGWKPTDSESVKHRNPDGERPEGNIQYRELILCEMPREKAENRNSYYRRRAEQALESARSRYNTQAGKLGFSTDVS